MATITLRKTRETRVRGGHPWIYASEIEKVEGAFENGDIVDVADFRGKFIGRGFYNPQSQISLRILTRRDEPCDRDFFARRIRDAWEYRKLLCDLNSCRLIYSESDFLPGLVVDKFGDILVLQSLSLGIERIKDMLCDLLMEIVEPAGIWERSDVPVRRLEGLEQATGLLRGEVPDVVEMRENGIRFLVDVKHGQKTGFFLDQRENRALVERYARGRNVLNLFCYTGGFSVYALGGGALHVDSVDSSAKAMAMVDRNIALNGFSAEQHTSFCADAIEHLAAVEDGRYDLIIVDPPAFAKHRGALKNALRAYQRLNARAIEKIAPGGLVFTFSCSQVVEKEAFALAVFSAAAGTGRRVRILDRLCQPADHAVNIYHPEGEYLKGLLLYVE